MLYKVFDFADKEVHEVMVPRPEVVAISISLPSEEALAVAARLAVHALSGLPGLARRDRGDPARARPLPRAARPRDRPGRARASCSGPSTSSPRRRTSRRCWPSSASRTSTWPSSSTSTARCRGSSRSRTCSRRSSARSRTSSTSRTSRSSGSTTRTSASTARSRSTTSTSSSGPSSRSRTTTRWPAPSSARSAARPRSATRSTIDGLSLRVIEIEGSRIQRLEVEFRQALPQVETADE